VRGVKSILLIAGWNGAEVLASVSSINEQWGVKVKVKVWTLVIAPLT